MGTNVSKQSMESITAITNQTMNNISTTIESGASTNLRTSQRLYINQGDIDTGGGDYNVTQSSNIVLSTIVNNQTQLSNDLTSSLMTQIRKELDTQIKQANEDLNLGQTNIAVQDTLTNTDIKNIISTSVNTTIRNTVQQTSENEQELNIRTLKLQTHGGDVNITQDLIIKAMAENISSNIVKNVIKSTITNEVAEKIKMMADQLNKGIDILAMFTVFIVIAVIGFGGFAYLRTNKMFNNIEKGIEKNSNAMAAKIGELDVNAAMPATTHKAYYGGDNNQALKIKLAIACTIVLGAGYFGYYLPEKQKIKDKYDLSYLNNI